MVTEKYKASTHAETCVLLLVDACEIQDVLKYQTFWYSLTRWNLVCAHHTLHGFLWNRSTLTVQKRQTCSYFHQLRWTLPYCKPGQKSVQKSCRVFQPLYKQESPMPKLIPFQRSLMTSWFHKHKRKRPSTPITWKGQEWLDILHSTHTLYKYLSFWGAWRGFGSHLRNWWRNGSKEHGEIMKWQRFKVL